MKIIAEIGNNHFGDFTLAREMIAMAKYGGADLVKFQILDTEMAISLGCSMPIEFYQKCYFSLQQYIDLIHYGNQIKIPVFFSIFTHNEVIYESIFSLQNHNKISAKQTEFIICDNIGKNTLDKKYLKYVLHNQKHDKEIIVSINEKTLTNKLVFFKLRPYLFYSKKSILLYATDYMSNGYDKDLMNVLANQNCKIGISDHSIGLSSVINACNEYKISMIEKHFTDVKGKEFNGRCFRDTLHAMDLHDLIELKKQLSMMNNKGKKNEMLHM